MTPKHSRESFSTSPRKARPTPKLCPPSVTCLGAPNNGILSAVSDRGQRPQAALAALRNSGRPRSRGCGAWSGRDHLPPSFSLQPARDSLRFRWDANCRGSTVTCRMVAHGGTVHTRCASVAQLEQRIRRTDSIRGIEWNSFSAGCGAWSGRDHLPPSFSLQPARDSLRFRWDANCRGSTVTCRMVAHGGTVHTRCASVAQLEQRIRRTDSIRGIEWNSFSGLAAAGPASAVVHRDRRSTDARIPTHRAPAPINHQSKQLMAG